MEVVANLNLISELASLVLGFIFGLFLDKFKIWKLATIVNIPILVFFALFLLHFEQIDTTFYIYYVALKILVRLNLIAYSVLFNISLTEKTRGTVMSVGSMIDLIPMMIFYKYASYLYD